MGWKGIEDEKGEPLEFNEGNSLRILTEYKDFREFILTIAMEAGNYREVETEAIAGN